VLPPQCEQLADSETAVAGQHDEGAVATVDAIGKPPQLVGRQEAHLLALDSRQG
jgi:hypothetical protein